MNADDFKKNCLLIESNLTPGIFHKLLYCTELIYSLTDFSDPRDNISLLLSWIAYCSVEQVCAEFYFF